MQERKSKRKSEKEKKLAPPKKSELKTERRMDSIGNRRARERKIRVI